MKVTNGEYFFSVINKIEDCLANYDRMSFQSNRFTMFLANDDVINIKTFKNNVPHLLGVKLDYLKQSNKFGGITDAYDQLKCFLDRRQVFFDLVSKGQLSFEPMFSKNIDEKLDIFVDSIKLRTDDIQYVVKYDSEKTYQFEDKAEICDYYIFRRFHGAYCILGLIKNDKDDYYVPATIRKYDNYNDFDEFMRRIAKKQEITYPTALKVRNNTCDYKQDFYVRAEDKKVLLEKAINAANKFDAVASVARDYTYSFGKLTDEKNKSSKLLSLFKMLTDNIKSGNALELDSFYEMCGEMELDKEIIELVDACNNMVCNSCETNSTSYSTISHERDSLKKELLEIKQEIIEKESQINELQQENNTLKEQNSNYGEQINVFEEAYQKVKRIRNEEN